MGRAAKKIFGRQQSAARKQREIKIGKKDLKMTCRYKKKDWDVGTLDNLDSRNSLRAWLEQNGFIRYGSSKGCDYTCTFLNGGTALIPDDKYKTFLDLMADEISNGRQWSVHENATRYSRLYFDLDIIETEFAPNTELSKSTIHNWCYVIQQAALEFFPQAGILGNDSEKPEKKDHVGGQMIVLSAPPVFATKQIKTSGARKQSSLSAKTWRDAERVALAQRTQQGSAPSQAQVLASLRQEQQETSTPVSGEQATRKTGLHLVFPRIICDLNEMLQVRAHVVERLRQEVPAPKGQTWDKIVDEQVYTGSAGLRMPGTLKVETCHVCKGDMKRRQTCDMCNGRPRSFVNRPYKPLMVLSTFGASRKKLLEKLASSNEVTLKFCSIRCVDAYQTRPPFVRPPTARAYEGPIVQYLIETPLAHNASWTNAKRVRTFARSQSGSDNKNKSSLGKRKLADGDPSSNTRQKSNANLDNEINGSNAHGSKVIQVFTEDHEVAKMLEEFIQRHTYPQWQTVQVSEVRQVLLPANSRFKTPGTIYLINVADSGSRYCLNNGGEHRSRSIYFLAKRSGIEQRCFCRCSTIEGRISGVPCGEFRSNVCEFLYFSLGRRIQERLFPTETRSMQITNVNALGSTPNSADFGSPYLTVEQNSNKKASNSILSLADVRKDTDEKRQQAGLNDSNPTDDNIKEAHACQSTVLLPSRPADAGSNVSALQTFDKERQLLDESSPSFKSLDAIECSYTPDYICQSASIDALVSQQGAGSQRAKKIQEQKQRQLEEETFVLLPTPVRDMAHYKRLVKHAESNVCQVAQEQINRYLQT